MSIFAKFDKSDVVEAEHLLFNNIEFKSFRKA